MILDRYLQASVEPLFHAKKQQLCLASQLHNTTSIRWFNRTSEKAAPEVFAGGADYHRPPERIAGLVVAESQGVYGTQRAEPWTASLA